MVVCAGRQGDWGRRGTPTAAASAAAAAPPIAAGAPTPRIAGPHARVALGVLLDTLLVRSVLVRSVLVPAPAVDFGERIWWPGRVHADRLPDAHGEN